MTVWFFAFFLTLAACLAVLRPFLGKGPDAEGAATDVDVYKDQLTELERDAQRGLIAPQDAAEARAEIARRILKADEKQARAASGAAGKFSRVAVTAAVLAIPVASWGLYAVLGSPDLPSQPLAERMARNPKDSTIEELIARAETQLRARPDDPKGWMALAPVYMRMGRFADSANAWREVIRLSGPDAQAYNGLGEALGAAAKGMLTPESRAAFAEALKLDPKNEKSRFFAAMAEAQDGKTDDARAAWQALADGAAADSPWKQASLEAIAASRQQAMAGPADGAPGPTAEQMQDAAQMSQGDRAQMIEGMVARLDAKLRDNPDDPEGWQRLIRAYAVMGREAEAAGALARAQAAFANDPQKKAAIEAFAQSLGSGDAPAAPAVPGPTAEQMKDAAAMSAGDRAQMIEGMVARLDAKLRDNPDDTEGWQRLIRAYAVMGKKAEAEDAVSRALDAFATVPSRKDEILAFAKSLGLDGPAAQ